MNVRQLHPGFVTCLWLLPVLTLLQVSIMHHISVGGVYPSLMLIAVVNWGILRGVDEGMLWAFLGGLCLDLFSGWPIGTSTVSLVIVASLVSLGGGTFIRAHALVPMGTLFVSTALYYAIALFIFESTQHTVDWIAAVQHVILPAALFNSLANIPGFWLTQRLERRVYPSPRAQW